MKAKAVYAQNILVVLGQTIRFEHFHEASRFFYGCEILDSLISQLLRVYPKVN